MDIYFAEAILRARADEEAKKVAVLEAEEAAEGKKKGKKK